MVALIVLIPGCSCFKEKEYSKVVDLALKANQELVAEYKWDEKYSAYEKEKSNDSWSSSPADRAKIKEFLDDNVPPIYKENNVELVADNMNMRWKNLDFCE